MNYSIQRIQAREVLNGVGQNINSQPTLKLGNLPSQSTDQGK